MMTSDKLIYDALYISQVLGLHNVTSKKCDEKINNILGKSYNCCSGITLTYLNTKIDSDEKIFSKRLKNHISVKNSKRSNKFILENNIPLTKLDLKPYSLPIEVYNIEVENTHSYVTEYGITHNCDANFATSGDTVFHPEFIKFYEETYIKEPLERRGVDHNLWIWENADYSRSYLVTGDVARGDGKDSSTAHVIDLESNTQVAEYKGQIGTKDFGNLLVALATEYNEALLAVENANIGWATIQQIIDKGYPNLYYSPKNDNPNEVNTYYDKYMDTSKMVAGFTTSGKTRPLMIGKIQEYISTKSVIIQSKRLLEEMKVFIWKNGRPEAQQGYNDDLVMAFAIAMYIRDTALIGKQRGIDITKQMLNNMHVNRTGYTGAYFSQGNDNPYNIDTPYGTEDISWLI